MTVQELINQLQNCHKTAQVVFSIDLTDYIITSVNLQPHQEPETISVNVEEAP